tara:strand:- start:34 stop:339 length:306 start_codon:yes stop_codon:yes gene_type:complete
MFKNDSKDEFMGKVVEYGIGVNLSGYDLEEFSIGLSKFFDKFTYYRSSMNKRGCVVVSNDKDENCEIEIGNLGIFFVNYDKEMAISILPRLVKYLSEKTFS